MQYFLNGYKRDLSCLNKANDLIILCSQFNIKIGRGKNMVEIIKKIIIEARVALYLAIAEKAFNSMFNDVDYYDEQFKTGREALDQCWYWVENGNVRAIDLYKLIDNPECDGTYEYGMEEQEYRKKVMWFSLTDAVAYTCWQAFHRENIKYLPQLIEGINEDLFNDYIKDAVDQKLVDLDTIDKIIKYLVETYSVANPLKSKILKKEIMNI